MSRNRVNSQLDLILAVYLGSHVAQADDLIRTPKDHRYDANDFLAPMTIRNELALPG